LDIISGDVWYAYDPFFNGSTRTDTESVETIPSRKQIMKRTIAFGIGLTALAFNTLVAAQSLPQAAQLYAEDGSQYTVDKMIHRQQHQIQLAEDGTEQTIDRMIQRQQEHIQPQLAADDSQQTIDRSHHRMHRIV